jgi:hypothetical protein
MTGIPAWAALGAKVAALPGNGEWRDALDQPTTGPEGGEVCTITEIDAGFDGVFIGLAGYGDGLFDLVRFRPVVPPKALDDDLSIFRPILDQIPVDA